LHERLDAKCNQKRRSGNCQYIPSSLRHRAFSLILSRAWL
jgi:hypothetical protein